VILYGTNTNFEFALPFDGFYVDKEIGTIPFESFGTVCRQAQLAIVEESDNLFLDAAQNSKRIGWYSNSHYELLHVPTCSNIHTISGLRRYLEKSESHKYIEEVRHLDNEMPNLTSTQKKVWYWVGTTSGASEGQRDHRDCQRQNHWPHFTLEQMVESRHEFECRSLVLKSEPLVGILV
jgi:hypothetical protein